MYRVVNIGFTKVARNTKKAEPKKMGRPVTVGATVLVAVKFPPPQVEEVDAWAKAEKVGRSEAVRRLVAEGLKKRRPRKPAGVE
ncbi:ribbon-helix-helix protein, CopG family [uncultured Reyranella sp.]|jgi:hypothetical protein|uniref:ribbon-helix-helix protein, CopG family n=1 Tax=uncultured Reyranella sp. TaxID=735512 RepID=UPI00259CE670|nr:ribbon-helix-helix protein, CopG family [uncultured Reyranella sp.]